MPIMGSYETVQAAREAPAGVAEVLFPGTQMRVPGWLFGRPERGFYPNEPIRLAGAGSGAVQRELARLASSGLVTVRVVGKQNHDQATPHAAIDTELRGIL